MELMSQVIDPMNLDTPEGIISFMLNIEASNISFIEYPANPMLMDTTAIYRAVIIVDSPDKEMREVITLDFATTLSVGNMRPCPQTPSKVKTETMCNFKLGRKNPDQTYESVIWDIDGYSAQSIYFELQHLINSDAFVPSFPGMHIRNT